MNEDFRSRDVHTSQQFERSNLRGNRRNKFFYILGVVLLTVLFLALVYVVSSVSYKIGSFANKYYDSELVDGNRIYRMKNEDGSVDEQIYYNKEDVPVPNWYIERVNKPKITVFTDFVKNYSFVLLIIYFVMMLIFFLIELSIRQTNDSMKMTEDVNQHEDDSHIRLVEDVMESFDFFPDTGYHSSVSPSSLISHVALSNKHLKNDVFDREFSEDLFKASGVTDKELMKPYSTDINYNKNNTYRDKLKGYDTLTDLIENDWFFPDYEVQKPSGAYIVDTAPVNTIVIAITRGGKGQTLIEPTLDMWTREKRPNNILANDPKGELLCKFYVPATYRGYQVVQFNLLNPLNTDIYNPIIMAAESAREGDYVKVASYVENIAEVFFPLDSGDDPVWANSANNAFKRAVYGLIDYYLEEEASLRIEAKRTNMDNSTLESKLDNLWGKVTLYNCYQLFVQLSSKRRTNPLKKFEADRKAGEFDGVDSEVINEKRRLAEKEAELWNGNDDIDLLSLYYVASSKLPRNQMRTLVENADNSLKAIGKAEKMLGSVYGIAITAMSYFTDPTISTLTSGTPSQNVDLAGLSFPRRLGFRINATYLEDYSWVGKQCLWEAYSDPNFENRYEGKAFEHRDTITRTGWAKFYFDGIFPKDVAYLKCTIIDTETDSNLAVFYFKFKKSYEISLDGLRYLKDPVLKEKIVKNGVMTEMIKVKTDKGYKFVEGTRTHKVKKLINNSVNGMPEVDDFDVDVISQYMLKYSEKPKMVFLITPPHMTKYTKLLLILIKQITDLNFDQSYMTKESQKPLYKTRYMLDELGNLESEGKGITNLETMASIGLGQDQQFTFILQTLQQLRDIYGDSVDKILQGNVSNIIYLKSTDSEMLKSLEDMGGKTHKSYIDSKTITQDNSKLFLKTRPDVTYSMATQERPVISYNDMAFIQPCNSIVFRAGDYPIWNRGSTALPMAWRLHANNIGESLSLQTVPTLSTAKDFDVRKNQPDFEEMLDKKIKQAMIVDDVIDSYKQAYGYDDYDIAQLDIDLYSAEIMEIVNDTLSTPEGQPDIAEFHEDKDIEDCDDAYSIQINQAKEELSRNLNKPDIKYSETFSRKVLESGDYNKELLIDAYIYSIQFFANDPNYKVDGKNLYSKGGQFKYISYSDNSELFNTINEEASNPDSRVFAEEPLDDVLRDSYEIEFKFIEHLTSLNSWTGIASGKFLSYIKNKESIS